MKVIAMLLTAIIAFFSWIASPFLPDKLLPDSVWPAWHIQNPDDR